MKRKIISFLLAVTVTAAPSTAVTAEIVIPDEEPAISAYDGGNSIDFGGDEAPASTDNIDAEPAQAESASPVIQEVQEDSTESAIVQESAADNFPDAEAETAAAQSDIDRAMRIKLSGLWVSDSRSDKDEDVYSMDIHAVDGGYSVRIYCPHQDDPADLYTMTAELTKKENLSYKDGILESVNGAGKESVVSEGLEGALKWEGNALSWLPRDGSVSAVFSKLHPFDFDVDYGIQDAYTVSDLDEVIGVLIAHLEKYSDDITVEGVDNRPERYDEGLEYVSAVNGTEYTGCVVLTADMNIIAEPGSVWDSGHYEDYTWYILKDTDGRWNVYDIGLDVGTGPDDGNDNLQLAIGE